MLVTMPTPDPVVNSYNTSGKLLWGRANKSAQATGAFLSYLTQPALLMSASAAISDPLLRQAFGQRARPSDSQRTVGDWRPSFWCLSPSKEQRDRHRHRGRSQSPGLRAPVSRHGSAISRRTVMNNVGSRRSKGPQMFMKYAGMTMEERDPYVAEWANTIRVEEIPTAAAPNTYAPRKQRRRLTSQGKLADIPPTCYNADIKKNASLAKAGADHGNRYKNDSLFETKGVPGAKSQSRLDGSNRLRPHQCRGTGSDARRRHRSSRCYRSTQRTLPSV